MIGATDIFVSYKAEDRARLVPLVASLEAEGFSVWWDTHIGGGAHWREDIQAHLDAAKCVIVAWTKRSVGPEGDFVRDEAAHAKHHGIYLPVRFDPVELPLGFREVQAISLKGWHGDRSDPRFLALTDAVRECVTGRHVARHYVHHEKGISRRAIVVGSVGVGTIAAAGVGGWLLLKPEAANAARIAVLPFVNLSGAEDQAYFAEGIAEELRLALSRIGMEVIGRASSDAVKELDTKVAAAKLDVANVLTGSVRRSPQMVRINAQLVSGKDGVERWAQSYDRVPGDEIKIQTDIAANVAQALSIALGQAGEAALTLGGTADSVAQDMILQSRKIRREASGADAFRRRVALTEAAIARDPAYADAYVEKANALSNLTINYVQTPAEVADQLAQADAAARKALALAPRFGSAHNALAAIALYRLDFAGALRESRESLVLSPQDADVLASASYIIGHIGSAEEGLELADRAIALDPLNGRAYRIKAEMLNYERRYLQAIEAGRTALELAPKLHTAHTRVGDALLLLGRPAQAKVEYEALAADEPFRLARLALLAARTGDRPAAERMIAQLRQQYGPTWSYQYGQIYAQLGYRDRAFIEFDNAIKAKDSGLAYLKHDPFLDPIRRDPRYPALLRRLKFP